MALRLEEEIRYCLLAKVKGSEIKDIIKGTRGIVYIIKLGVSYPPFVAFKTYNVNIYKNAGKIAERLVREAKVWLRLGNYPLILTPLYVTTIYCQETRFPLIAMPYCEYDLRKFMDKQMKLKDLLLSIVIALQICKALIYMKEMYTKEKEPKFSHQDLKPENILIRDLYRKYADIHENSVLRWQVRLADFGLANAWYESGYRGSTFPYMAPEQFLKGKKGDPSKADVFSFGVILTEMITGSHPCGKTTFEVWTPRGKLKKECGYW